MHITSSDWTIWAYLGVAKVTQRNSPDFVPSFSPGLPLGCVPGRCCAQVSGPGGSDASLPLLPVWHAAAVCQLQQRWQQAGSHIQRQTGSSPGPTDREDSTGVFFKCWLRLLVCLSFVIMFLVSLQVSSSKSHRASKVLYIGGLKMLLSTGSSPWNHRQIVLWDPVRHTHTSTYFCFTSTSRHFSPSLNPTNLFQPSHQCFFKQVLKESKILCLFLTASAYLCAGRLVWASLRRRSGRICRSSVSVLRPWHTHALLGWKGHPAHTYSTSTQKSLLFGFSSPYKACLRTVTLLVFQFVADATNVCLLWKTEPGLSSLNTLMLPASDKLGS